MNARLLTVVRAIRKMPTKRYLDYLRSPNWKKTREEHLVRCGYRCEECGSPATQVHHATYDRLGYEEPRDLVAVCVRCHHKIHINVFEPANDNQLPLPLAAAKKAS